MRVMTLVMQVLAGWTALSFMLAAVFARWMHSNERQGPIAPTSSAFEAEVEALVRVPA